MRAPPQYIPYDSQSAGEVSIAASRDDASEPDLPPLQHDSDADSGTDDDGSSVSSSSESHPSAQAFRALIRRFAGDSSECEIFHIDGDDSDDAPDFAHPAYTEETEFAYTDKLAPLWNGPEASYL